MLATACWLCADRVRAMCCVCADRYEHQCWFKPTARIKLYDEGDPVLFNSQILFDSAHVRGKVFLSCEKNSSTLVATEDKKTGFRIRLFAVSARPGLI